MDERLTTAVRCNNCGKLFGYIVSAIEPKTTPLQAVCAECFGEITRREGRALNTAAEWSVVLNKNQ
jgi:hypothetical protein